MNLYNGHALPPTNEACEREQQQALNPDRPLPPDLFMVWARDDIDSSFFEDTDEPRPLYVAILCRDTDDERPDVIRGYDPRDGIFERPGRVVESLGGIDATSDDEYRDEIACELLAAFEARREAMIVRGEN